MKLLKRLLMTVGGLLLVLCLLIVGAGIAGVDVRLDPLKPAIELAARKALDRQVSVNGPIHLTVSFWPSLTVADVTVANPPGWPEGDQLSFREVKGQVALAPLLSRELKIPSLSAEGVRINFVRNEKGESNLAFKAKPDKPKTQAVDDTAKREDLPIVELSELDEFAFRDIVMEYRDPETGFLFALEEMTGSAPRDDSIEISLRGSIQEAPYAFDINGGSLADLMSEHKSWDIDINGHVASSKIVGTGALNPEKSPAEASFNLKVTPLDIGALLSHGIVDDLSARVDAVSLALKLKGDDPGQVLDLSELQAQITAGTWVLNDANTGDFATINIETAQFQALPKKPIALDIKGALDDIPVSIGVQTSDLATLIRTDTHVPLKINIEGIRTKLSLQGTVDMPIASESMTMDLAISGERLDTLNGLLDTSLPPLGPYSLDGSFDMTPGTYTISDLALHVGDSDLKGQLTLTTAGVRPNLSIDLNTKRLQINDFDTGDWSAFEDQDAMPTPEADDNPDDPPPQETAEALLSRDTMSQIDASLTLKVDEVVSGNDTLGRGHLETRLKDARFSIDPLTIDVPSGSINFKFGFEPTETEVKANLFAHIDKFDYGNLARRVEPETDMSGLFSLDVDINSVAPTWKDVMTRASGHFDLAIWPKSFEAGILDMWAVNIIAASVSEMDKKNQSVINCVVGRFDINDGLLTQDAVLLDTSRLRVWGYVDINLKNEKLKLKLYPQAKKPEYFSLATPVSLRGTLRDFELKVPKGALLGTGAIFITSPIHATLRRLMKEERLPENGEDVCVNTMDRNVPLRPPEFDED